MIVTTVCDSFLEEALRGNIHLETDTYKLALYTNAANLDRTTTLYTTNGEVVGPGYEPGGMTITGWTIKRQNGVSFVTFDPVRWAVATLKNVTGALVHNASKGNRAVGSYLFDEPGSSTKSEFLVSLPVANEFEAVIRIGTPIISLEEMLATIQ